VVLSGRATIAVYGGPTFDIGPGDVCIWNGGERTIWSERPKMTCAYGVSRLSDVVL
jgi:hypothetical protein